jgi:hypothetical protein
MATALLHLDEKQKRRLARRARLRGKSFSQEVRDALDLYLAVPVETEARPSNTSIVPSRGRGTVGDVGWRGASGDPQDYFD